LSICPKSVGKIQVSLKSDKCGSRDSASVSAETVLV